MSVDFLKLDTTDEGFCAAFEKYKLDVFAIFSNSYELYYGDQYQINRIIEDRSTLYLALISGTVVGVSYIKGNFRRGGTAVFPEKYRRLGIAEKLVRESLNDFPMQYTVLSSGNIKMIALMEKIGFRKAASIEEVKLIVKEEFSQFFNFAICADCLTFNRKSLKRSITREGLVLLHSYK